MKLNESCFYTLDDQKKLAIARGVVGGGVLVLCVTTLIVWFCKATYEAVKEHRIKLQTDLLHRQYAYLSVVNIATLLMFIIQYFETVKDTDSKFCSTVGFFVQLTSCAQLFTVFWIVCNLVATFKPAENETIETDLNTWLMKCKFIRNQVCADFVWGTAILFLTFLFSIFPWINASYGPVANGGLCWIRSANLQNCQTYSGGLAMQWLLWYIPSLLTGIASTVMLFFACHYARQTYKNLHTTHKDLSEMEKQELRKRYAIGVVLAFYVVPHWFSVLMEFIIRCYVTYQRTSAHHTVGQESLGLWIAYAVVVPLIIAAMPIAFLVYVCLTKPRNRGEEQKILVNADSD